MHYWTGRGTLCSLDNSTTQKPTHTNHRERVTCKWCLGLFALRDSRELVVKENEVARTVAART